MQALPRPFPTTTASMQSGILLVNDPSSKQQPPFPSTERSRDLELLVRECEASLQRFSEYNIPIPHSFHPANLINSTQHHHCVHTSKPTVQYYEKGEPNSNNNSRLRPMDVLKKDEIVTVTVTELPTAESKTAAKSRKSKNSVSDSTGRKFKVTKPKSRPSLSRTNSGSATTSSSNDSCDSLQEAIVVEEAGVISPPFMPSPGIALNGTPPVDYFSTQPKQLHPTTPNHEVTPSDGNVCGLLRTGIATCDVALTELALSYLRKRAIYHPLIVIKACAPFACPHPSFPVSVIPYVRPILQDAIRTLLDDFPEYDSGEASTRWNAYLDSVPPVLQELFSHEWCRYVRRIKSFHENSPFDDFDYDHSHDCLGGRHACEERTREVVRDAWNAFWKESILTGNRCVPRPSQVAKFFCTYGDDDTEEERTNVANSRCRAGFKEELIQTLECIGGVNSKWCWRFLQIPLDSLFAE